MAGNFRDMMGGGLRPGDPRRWLIEAMIGAMVADGSLDDRELAVLRRQLEEQDLFAGLSQQAVDTLIDIGQDAQVFAGGSGRRVAAISRHLYTRTHRLAAYAMACEVCAADGFIADGEVMYLEALRKQLYIFDNEAFLLLDMARAQMAMPALEQRMNRLRALVPALVDCFALKAIWEGRVSPEHQHYLATLLKGLTDVNVVDAYLDQQLQRAFHGWEVRRDNIQSQVGLLGAEIPDVGDRFWVMVYLMIEVIDRGIYDWSADKFLRGLMNVFKLNAGLMSEAMDTARLFPRTAR